MNTAKEEIIYELHVKGFSHTNTNLPKTKRGKFLGVSDDFSIKHLKSLGVTSVQLMPVFDSSDGTYWHYGSCSWMKLNESYGSLTDFKLMLKQLHSVDIKVILDVVYNNSHGFNNKEAENGIYNYAWDVSGCGRTVDVKKSLPAIEASMKYWLNEIGVDGCRFDLCNILGREGGNFKPEAEFFEMTKQFKDKMLIAEPWDVAEVSQGRYPDHFWELNGWFRDCVLSGHDYVESSLLPAKRSVNFITCHDNKTMEDKTYGHKDHKDWLRKKLMESKGHKMILMGDEESLCNSMNGCGNGYMLDNELGWLNWKDYKGG